MMKVAFLMQCHKNPEQINLLLKALKHPQVDVYVHVDSKSENIREDIEKSDGVYADNVKPYLHYIKWENGMSSPKTLTTIDYEELKKTEKIIARKFDMDVDSEIIERLRKR